MEVALGKWKKKEESEKLYLPVCFFVSLSICLLVCCVSYFDVQISSFKSNEHLQNFNLMASKAISKLCTQNCVIVS